MELILVLACILGILAAIVTHCRGARDLGAGD